MAERLTDEHLAAWADFDGEGIIDFGDVQAMVAEIRERRAADLTPDEINTLRALREETAEFGMSADDDSGQSVFRNRTLAVLDKLLGGAK